MCQGSAYITTGHKALDGGDDGSDDNVSDSDDGSQDGGDSDVDDLEAAKATIATAHRAKTTMGCIPRTSSCLSSVSH